MLGVAPPESDLYLPLPEAGETWHPYTIHTHYFGAQLPEAEIGCFIYIRYQPAFPLAQGGIVVFRGLDHVRLMDAEYVDYEATMAWPEIEGNRITTSNGLSVEFLTPGEKVRVSYRSPDGVVSLNMLQEAITPLVTRGHVMPGEELHHGEELQAGGTEQFMHATGTLELDGSIYAIDCLPIRDRSWRQVRTDTRGAVITPPIGWSPMCFGPDLAFNQVGYEGADTDPEWQKLGLFPHLTPEDRAHHFAWILVDGELRDVPTVRRTALEHHPTLLGVSKQEIEAVDERGATHRFFGEAIAISEIFVAPNQASRDSVYRWTTENGRVAYAPYQEVWHNSVERAIRENARAGRVPARG